jgi:outer membrane receptor protein involved in Fe transport
MVGRRTIAGVAALAAAGGLAGPVKAADAATEVSELVVTAERSNRRLDQTATSVAVVTAAEAEDTAGVYTTDDIVSRLANVVSIRPSNSAPAIRGVDGTGPAVGGNAFFAGTRPRVNYFVDGRALTFNEAIYLDGGIWDLQQVEVYRGPQSLLQGRNSIAGVIAVKTADPTFDWSGKARVIVGGRSLFQSSAAIGGPLIDDKLAFRLSADYRKDKLYTDFTAFDSLYGRVEEPENTRSVALRGKLLFEPTDDFRTLLTLSHTNAYAPQGAQVNRPFKALQASFPHMPRFKTRANVAIADTDWAINDAVRLSALLSAADYRVRRYAEIAQGNALIDGDEYAADVRLHLGQPDARLTGFIAGYWFKQTQDEFIDFFDGSFDDATNTRAVFGELTYKATDRLDLRLGARYEEEERDRDGVTTAIPILIDFHETFSAFLPRATATWRATDDLTVGATAGRGYNAGGIAVSFDFPFPTSIYRSEYVWNYELFARGRLFDPRLTFSANVFYNDYKNLQLPFDINPDPTVSSLVIRNAQRATTYGAEFEARFRIAHNLDAFGQAGLLKTKVNEYDDPTVQGNDLLHSPAFTLSLGMSYEPPQGFGASFDARYSDAYYSDAFNDARGKVHPYATANAQVSYRTGPARAFLAVTNLFDTIAATDISPGATRAEDSASITTPRRVSAGVEFAF